MIGFLESHHGRLCVCVCSEKRPSRAELSILVAHNEDPIGIYFFSFSVYNEVCFGHRPDVCLLS